MGKRRKSPEAKAAAQLESDREWLVRTTLLGKGYIVKAFEAAKDAGDQTAMTLYARHLAEMDLAINGCRPAAECVLQRLGGKVADAEAKLAKLLAAAIGVNRFAGEVEHKPVGGPHCDDNRPCDFCYAGSELNVAITEAQAPPVASGTKEGA